MELELPALELQQLKEELRRGLQDVLLHQATDSPGHVLSATAQCRHYCFTSAL
jgi:hypothetical protein